MINSVYFINHHSRIFGRFALQIIFFVITFSAIAMANVPVSGQVFSTDGNPLAYAVITDFTEKNWVIADENGQFVYHFGTEIGDQLSISRYGYQTTNLNITDQSYYLVVLSPQAIEQKSITVIGANNEFAGQIANSYSKISSNNTQNLFQQIPGVSIRSYGGQAGIMNLSSNGGSSVNTKILLGDVDLTSIQNGESDLSQLPGSIINQITVVKSPGILHGSGATDNVLKINPWQNGTSISISSGSFGNSAISGFLHNNWNRISQNIFIGYSKTDGNYDYEIGDSTTARKNNDIERKYFTINNIIRLSAKSNLKLLLIESQQKRGVAGSLNFPSPLARRADKLLLGSITYNHLNKNGFSKINLSRRKSDEKYIDPNSFFPIASDHEVNGNVFKIQQNQIIRNDVILNLLYEIKQEKINSSDVGNHERITQSFAAEIANPLLTNLKVIPAIRFDKITDRNIHRIESLRLSYSGLDNTEIEYNIGSGFRSPTFNDLYWQPGGNPALKPEESWYQSLKYKLYLKNNFFDQIYLNIFDRQTDDLIQWVPISPNSFVGQPQNIANSRRTNVTIGGRITINSLPLQIALHTTYQKTKNIDLDKALLYAPEIIGFIGLNYFVGEFNFGFHAHYNGGRLAEYGLSDDLTLAGYWSTSTEIQYKTNLFGNNINWFINIDNLFNKQYMSINGYPEPGRTINVGLQYSLSD